MAWANTAARIRGPLSFWRMMRGVSAMRPYLEERLRAAREHGGEGLIADLVRVEKEGGRISGEEMVAMVFLLLGAGSETTTHLISGSVFELLKYIHFCLGFQLARLEGKCALKALLTRWPKLALAVPPDEIRWLPRPGLKAIEKLPVTAGVE